LNVNCKQEISDVFSKFLHEQFGEHAASVITYISGTMFTIHAANCFAPGEQDLVQNNENWQLLQEVKIRQYDEVEPLLTEQFEELTDCKISGIYSMVCQDGGRFIVIKLSQNLENKLNKSEEIVP